MYTLLYLSFRRSEPVDFSRTSNIAPGSRSMAGAAGTAAAGGLAAAANPRHGLEPSAAAAGSSPGGGSSSIESMIKQRKPSGIKTGSSHEMLLKNVPFEVGISLDEFQIYSKKL